MRDPEAYTPLIIKIAKQFKPSFPRQDLEDLIQEGYQVFVEMHHEEKDKPWNCPFPTALAVQIRGRLLNRLKREKAQRRGNRPKILSLDTDLNEENKEFLPPTLVYNPTEKINKYLNLPSEMKVVTEILRDGPSEFVTLCKSFNLIESLFRYLEQFRGWDKNQLEKLKLELSRI